MCQPPFDVDPKLEEIALACKEAGGRALLVGGWVRDRLRGEDSKDWDYEVYGLTLDTLEEVLSTFGEVIHIGRAFGVLRVKGLELDISLPRRDSKTGRGHRGFVVDLDPTLDIRTASRRRDLTINAISYDPLTEELLDPFDGIEDLRAGRLRAVDPDTFAEDSLRALRVAQFSARLEMQPDAALLELCASLDLTDLPGERIQQELDKLLLRSERPSIGFEFLRSTGLLRLFPEAEALVGVPQDAEWHPEGDVWVHTMMVLDEAAALRSGDGFRDRALMLGALCHDFGKATTTVTDEAGRIRSPGHEEAGVEPARAFLDRLRYGHDLMDAVEAITRHHLAPAMLFYGKATDRGYRRLARRLAALGVDARLLYISARADHFGRTTADALAREFPEGDHFLERMEALSIARDAPGDVVQGRDLIARGFEPGPSFGVMLARCRDVQDEYGWTEADRILDFVLSA